MSDGLGLELEVKTPSFPATENTLGVVREELLAATELATLDLTEAVVPLTPANFGLLRDAWGREVTAPMTSDVAVLGRVFNPSDYAPPVEYGSVPHWPPREPIQAWVESKLGVTDEAEARRVAFLVARKISKDGTPAFRMLATGWEQTLEKMKKRYSDAFERIVKRVWG